VRACVRACVCHKPYNNYINFTLQRWRTSSTRCCTCWVTRLTWSTEWHWWLTVVDQSHKHSTNDINSRGIIVWQERNIWWRKIKRLR